MKNFYSNGELKDSEMERAGILSTMKIPTPKDELTIHRQRAILLSHEKTLKRWKDYDNKNQD